MVENVTVFSLVVCRITNDAREDEMESNMEEVESSLYTYISTY